MDDNNPIQENGVSQENGPIQENNTTNTSNNTTTNNQTGKLGVIGFVFSLVGLVVAGIPCGIAAIILTIMSLAKKEAKKGFSIAGLIIGILDVIVVVAALALQANQF